MVAFFPLLLLSPMSMGLLTIPDTEATWTPPRGRKYSEWGMSDTGPSNPGLSENSHFPEC